MSRHLRSRRHQSRCCAGLQPVMSSRQAPSWRGPALPAPALQQIIQCRSAPWETEITEKHIILCNVCLRPEHCPWSRHIVPCSCLHVTTVLTWHRPMAPAEAMQAGSAAGMPARTSLIRRRAELALPGNCPKHMSPASRNASSSLDNRCFGQVDLPRSVLCLLMSSASPAEETTP